MGKRVWNWGLELKSEVITWNLWFFVFLSYYLQVNLLLLVYLYTSNILYTEIILPGISLSLSVSNLQFLLYLEFFLSVGIFSFTKWFFSILGRTVLFSPWESIPYLQSLSLLTPRDDYRVI